MVDFESQFSLANRGSIFLDEIGRMSVGQAKLLPVLQEREIEPLVAERTSIWTFAGYSRRPTATTVSSWTRGCHGVSQCPSRSVDAFAIHHGTAMALLWASVYVHANLVLAFLESL
ncbi:MAG TPA: sigma 54-interacting transcriptional regulator [Gemmatimonadaceae bacterium]|nr:sigma 54-interacting transcriptional regulator [Gemmatimonadaceae bacterium]